MTAASPWVPLPGRPPTGGQRAARAVGGTFLAVGVLGFLPGATSHLGGIAAVGPGSRALLLGLLPVTVAGNAVHLVLGVVGLLSTRTPERARRYLVWGGGVYALLCLRSIVVDSTASAAAAGPPPESLVPLWLATAAGVALLAGGAAWSVAPGGAAVPATGRP